ncbi:MAG: hypothetical protein GFH27_549287n310 [Chloroflexi bacterium AL-W]|nr:hypothetical protein [Chloroflexi bacterium AL-N1]NOK66584.1 hypothetical protein [Chloroflexi bacterium AL-N10]NOK71972.1 hypothetical protein [Chloroflexi bacterium AL-N5]NOK81229.1 hypothetical protein [Chloroflexi bacterium AL-W]NOK89502.1 hypothetical protein [Chloroflexi bacterium AL-N15]
MRRLVIVICLLCLVFGLSIFIPGVRNQVRAIVRPEPPAPITPIALVAPATVPTAVPTARPPTPTALVVPTTQDEVMPTAVPTAWPPTPTVGPVTVNGRVYDAYIPSATKDSQAYQYSCEFDAAWVIMQTYGLEVSVDDLIAAMPLDQSIEPYIGEETSEGRIIHGGDIGTVFAGDYTSNFLARSTGTAMSQIFEQYGLTAQPVRDRAGVENALRAGSLVWMKTTVDFKPWQPAIWQAPDGSTYRTVLGNDHAVVVMGFNAESVVIRDVLGPTSSNLQRPYEYEVDWETFLASWGAQSFDGLAIVPPTNNP